MHGLSLVAASGGYSSLTCTGFSSWWLLLLRSTGSRHVGFSSCGTWASVIVARGLSRCGLWALEHRLSSCGTRTLLLRGMWDLPGPRIEPTYPALAGGFLTTVPPGKFLYWYLIKRDDHMQDDFWEALQLIKISESYVFQPYLTRKLLY